MGLMHTLVTVVMVGEVRPHNNADNLDLVTYDGDQYIVGRGSFRPGDLAFLFSRGSSVPERHLDTLGIRRYYDPKRGIARLRLRGSSSAGLLVPVEATCEPHAWVDVLIEIVTLGFVRRIWREGDDASEFWS